MTYRVFIDVDDSVEIREVVRGGKVWRGVWAGVITDAGQCPEAVLDAAEAALAKTPDAAHAEFSL